MLENYVYFELCSNLRLVPDQIDIEAAAQCVVSQLDSLRKLNTWGVMLGSASEIFKHVPDICEFALRRKEELATGVDLHCEETFQNLKAAITGWKGNGDDEDSLYTDKTFFPRQDRRRDCLPECAIPVSHVVLSTGPELGVPSADL